LNHRDGKFRSHAAGLSGLIGKIFAIRLQPGDLARNAFVSRAIFPACCCLHKTITRPAIKIMAARRILPSFKAAAGIRPPARGQAKSGLTWPTNCAIMAAS